jgi:hypothetical protein
MKEKRFIIVFAKEPAVGQVKTRLKECLSEIKIVELYKAFIKDTIELINKCRNANKIMAYHSAGNPWYLKSIAADYFFYKQKGASLGQRLYKAFVFAKDQGATKTVVVGSDAPDLPPEYIETAYCKLSKYDVVLGPARDGGYYLVALKKPIRNIFQEIKWSTSSVLEQSLRKAKAADQKVYLLRPWRDIDQCDDLKLLSASLKTNKGCAQHTRRFLYGKCFK